MLKLIGLGLEMQDLSIKAVQEIITSQRLFLEEYTSHGINKQELELFFNRLIESADRDFVESGKILDNAKDEDVALLILGDPLIATTHTDLLLRCKEHGIRAKVVHNNSIYNSITDTGLQIYKFGKTTTIPYWETNYEPTSFLDVIEQNHGIEAHTLCLLDIKKDQDKYMQPQDAIAVLENAQQKTGKNIFDDKTKIIVCSRMGTEDQSIKYLSIKDAKKTDLGGTLHMLIFPATLHEMELEFLTQFS